MEKSRDRFKIDRRDRAAAYRRACLRNSDCLERTEPKGAPAAALRPHRLHAPRELPALDRTALGSRSAGGFSGDESISNRAITRARRSSPSASLHHSQFAPGGRRARHRPRRRALYLGQRRQAHSRRHGGTVDLRMSAMGARSSRRRLTTRWSSCPSTIPSSRRRTRRSSPCRASSPRLAPDNLNQVFYGSSGSESNDTAIRLIRHYWVLKGEPKRRIIISRKNAYHGSTIAAGSMGGMAHVHAHSYPVYEGFRHIMDPYWYGESERGRVAGGVRASRRARARGRDPRGRARERRRLRRRAGARRRRRQDSARRPTGRRCNASSTNTASFSSPTR